MNIHQSKLQLQKRLWEEGYVAFFAGGKRPERAENIDIIAMKNGDVMIFSVQNLESGSSTRVVSNIGDELRAIKTAMEAPAYTNGGNVEAYFAIKKKFSEIWHLADHTTKKLRYKEDYIPLREVV